MTNDSQSVAFSQTIGVLDDLVREHAPPEIVSNWRAIWYPLLALIGSYGTPEIVGQFVAELRQLVAGNVDRTCLSFENKALSVMDGNTAGTRSRETAGSYT